jgi:hypothetical protein
MSVWLDPGNPDDASSVLYHLREDGSVETVDVVRNHMLLEYPVFMRSPLHPKGAIRLYWLRTGQDIDWETGRLESEVMVRDGDVKSVSVPLRYGEGVFAIHAFPGNATFTATLFRRNNVPTRFEVLGNVDHKYDIGSPTRWTSFEHRAQTDSPIGVAWLSPEEYVVPVAHEERPRDLRLNLYRTQCERFGSRPLDSSVIDMGFSEAPWQMMAVGSRRLLVIQAQDAARLSGSPAEAVPWSVLDVRTGKTNRTLVRWRSESAWAWVSPPRATKLHARAKCDDQHWEWP